MKHTPHELWQQYRNWFTLPKAVICIMVYFWIGVWSNAVWGWNWLTTLASVAWTLMVVLTAVLTLLAPWSEVTRRQWFRW